MMTDTERIAWLEMQQGCGLISDDQGRWAVSAMGMQNLPNDDEPFDFVGSFFVEASDWRPTIREAIDAAVEKDARESTIEIVDD
jgi:hypothetical protein